MRSRPGSCSLLVMERTRHESNAMQELLQCRRNQRSARLTLMRMKRLAALAVRYTALPQRSDLCAPRAAYLRERWRELYRDATGVDIDLHESLQPELEHLARTGDRSVEDLVQASRAGLLNGLGPQSGSAADGDAVPESE